MAPRRYTELIRLPTFEERFAYLTVGGVVGESTFGSRRSINQQFYHSYEWRSIRNQVIVRDNGCDLAHPDYPILSDQIIVHHMCPLEVEDFSEFSEYLLDPEYLVCVSLGTHNAIHYGDKRGVPRQYVERRPNDTCPWK